MSANSIAAGWEVSKSGRFQGGLPTPLLGDGPRRRLIEVSTKLGFEVFLLGRTSQSDGLEPPGPARSQAAVQAALN
jgi:hypothetical protein